METWLERSGTLVGALAGFGWTPGWPWLGHWLASAGTLIGLGRNSGWSTGWTTGTGQLEFQAGVCPSASVGAGIWTLA